MPEESLEIFPVLDEHGRVIGSATRAECHNGSRIIHPVVHLHVFNAAGDIYLQRRALDKRIQPGKWDTAVGGHVDFGETIEDALRRETREELGFEDFTPQQLFNYLYDSRVEREMVYAFACVTEHTDFDYNPDEVIDGRFWTAQEIEQAIGKGILTPNFEEEYRMIQALDYSINRTLD